MKKKDMQELTGKVEEYFKDVEHTVTTQDLGCVILVDVSYQDFRNTSRVRHELHLLDPNIVVGNLERYYSAYALENAITLMATQWMATRTLHQGIPDMPDACE